MTLIRIFKSLGIFQFLLLFLSINQGHLQKRFFILYKKFNGFKKYNVFLIL